jgi:hypothetical protein
VTSALPGELLASVGLALVFVPLSRLALSGVNDDDAGVASAVIRSRRSTAVTSRSGSAPG